MGEAGSPTGGDKQGQAGAGARGNLRYRRLTVLSARAMWSTEFLRLGLPAAAFLLLHAVALLQALDGAGRVLTAVALYLPAIYFITRFIVVWTRMLLVPETENGTENESGNGTENGTGTSAPRRPDGILTPRWGAAEWKVLGLLVLLRAGQKAPTLLSLFLGLHGGALALAGMAWSALFAVLVGRLLFLFPVVILGHRPHVATAWRAARGGGAAALLGAAGTFLVPILVAFFAAVVAVDVLQSWFPAWTAAAAPLGIGPTAFPAVTFAFLYVAALGAITTVAAVGYGLATGRVGE